MRLFKSKEYAFHTDLSVEECINRLRQSIVEEKFYRQSQEHKELIGRITGNKFRLTEGTRPDSFFSYKYSPGSGMYFYFYGEFIPDINGTKIIGYVGSKWGVLIYISILIFLLWISFTPSPKFPFPNNLFLVFSILPVWILMIFAVYEGTKQTAFKLFQTTLEAKPLFTIKTSRVNADKPNPPDQPF